MPPPYDNRGPARSRRGVWAHWVPLIVSVTVATVGVAAWALSQRKDEQEAEAHAGLAEHDAGLDYEDADYDPAYRNDLDGPGPGPGPGPAQAASRGLAGPSWASPQQILDSTGKTVAAGVAAASAAVGKALASIREDERSYTEEDASSEEEQKEQVKKDKDTKPTPATLVDQRRKKTVAIVVSADTRIASLEDGGLLEHASILSHIPRYNDLSMLKIFVLIYAPGLKDPLNDASECNRPPPSETSSFSNIGHDQAQTPGEDSKSPVLSVSTENPFYNAVYSEALSLVSKETMILPFTTPNGYTYILRHLQPEILYLQESLAGDNGSLITSLQTWLRHDVVLVVGAESGHGGLADSESEAERAEKPGNNEHKLAKWWQKPERVGRGRGVVVVDGIRVHEDWASRVQNRE